MAMGRNDTLREIERVGVVALIRAESAETTIELCRALAEGGVTTCEITMTTPGALEAIASATAELGERCTVGVGTVLDAETARMAILAGAEFVVSPCLDVATIAMAHRYDKVVIPGALTPTEVVAAWSAGADVVKIFPANHFGPRYFADLRGPLPQIRLTPTGGVDLDTTPAWIAAGAVAVGVGSALARPDLIAAGAWSDLSELAARYVAAVESARSNRNEES
jgi:2-dehydro-3-deoxyphosphogluconate aldolase/(4S)-4-hydroxy-2-oxoglutarate aldolase